MFRPSRPKDSLVGVSISRGSAAIDFRSSSRPMGSLCHFAKLARDTDQFANQPGICGPAGLLSTESGTEPGTTPIGPKIAARPRRTPGGLGHAKKPMMMVAAAAAKFSRRGRK